MPTSNDPTHPKAIEDIDDVEGHAIRVKADAADQDVTGFASRRLDAAEGSDDVDGHAARGKA